MLPRLFSLVKENAWLIAIVALGAGLRFYGINFGLPYTYAPDETWHLAVPLRMLKEADPNPQWLGYPHLAFYLNALALLIYFLIGRALGVFQSLADLPYADVIAVGVGKLDLPAEFLISRGLTALFGTASILIVYLIGRRLHPNKLVGLIAALLFAVSPASVQNSHLIRLDTFAVFFLLLAALWIDRALIEPGWRNYIWAGVGVGLAIAGKYNAGLIVVALIVAHWLNFGRRGFMRKEIYLAGIASFIAFAITNPFSILDLPGFFKGLGMASAAQSSHAGMEGDTVAWYAEFLWGTESWLVLLALLQAARIALTRDKRGIVLLSFPVLYYAFINSFAVRNDRTVMLVIPYLDLLAALFLIFAYEKFIALRFSNRTAAALLMLVIVAMAFTPFNHSFQNNLNLLKTDSRETARLWIENNLPAGSRILVEPYGPYVDPQRFVVEGVGITERPLDWYIQNGFEYMVFSYGSYGRFYEARERYAETVQQYDAAFARFPALKRFNDGGYEIRIHQTGVTGLPAQRIGARFGIFGGWLELVGYDLKSAQAGKPIDLVLHWRTLAERREAINLTARLLDRAESEIAQSTAHIFPGGTWQAGIVRVPLSIASPGEPGLVRIELTLAAAGQGRVPVLSRNAEPVSDKLFIDALKLAPAPIPTEELQRARPANVKFGDAITLLGYMIQSQADTAIVTLYWKADAKTSNDYTVFLHLIDAKGNLRAQIDAPPRGDAYPTLLWAAGEIVRDDYSFSLRDFSAGEYRVVVGMYEQPSLARLNLFDAAGNSLGDHLILNDAVQISK